MSNNMNNEQLELSLQTYSGIVGHEEGYSTTVEFFDFLPWWQGRSAGPKIMKKSIPYRQNGQKLTLDLTIKPALLENSRGESTSEYPTKIHETIESAVRKLMSEKISARQTRFSQDPTNRHKENLQTVITLAEIYKELKDTKHCHSRAAILKALAVLNDTRLEIRGIRGKDEYYYGSHPVLAYQYFSTEDENSRETHFLFTFHPLVAAGIKELSYRRYNYILGSKLGALAKYLHKQITNRFTWAEYRLDTVPKPYTIDVANLIKIQPAGLTGNTLSACVGRLQEALDELTEKQILEYHPLSHLLPATKRPEKGLGYAIERRYQNSPTRGKSRGKPKLIQALLHLYPSSYLASEFVESNRLHSEAEPRRLKTS